MDSQTDPQSSAASAQSGSSVQSGSTDAGPAQAGAAQAGTDPGAAPGAGTGVLASTIDELRKVVWPSRQQLFGESVAVILMVTLSAFAIAALDRFYSWLNGQVFR